MSYTKHNFETGDILYASQLNEMDDQIAANEEAIENSVSSDMLAEDYSANKTYSIGDYVIYNNELYTCIYEITAPEGWNSVHWRIENLGDGISELNRQISELIPDVNELKSATKQLADIKNITAETNIAPLFTKAYTDSKASVSFTSTKETITLSGTSSAACEFELFAIVLEAGSYYLETPGYMATEWCLIARDGSANQLARSNTTPLFTLESETTVKFYARVEGAKTVSVTFTPKITVHDFVFNNESLSALHYGRSNNLVDIATCTRCGYIDNNGTVGAHNANYFYTPKIDVSPGDVISYSSSRFIAYYNGDTFVSGLNNPTSPQTVPIGVNKMVISGYASAIGTFMVNKGSSLMPYAPYYEPKPHKTNVIVCGDSWTDIVNTTYIRWPVLVNKLDEFNVTSYGLTGSNISGTATGHVSSQVAQFLSDAPEADVVIIMGGINDYRGNVAYSTLVTAITDYKNSIIAKYPNIRFIYVANCQLYYNLGQIKFFNNIVNELIAAGIEAYTSFAWFAPNQYADDFLHAGNAGNVLIANNILAILRGGEIKRVNNKYYTEWFNDNNQRIGQFVTHETWQGGYPVLYVKGLYTSAMAGVTKTKTISTKSCFVSAPCNIIGHFFGSSTERTVIYTPNADSVDTYNQCTSFVLTSIGPSSGSGYFSGQGFVGDYTL